MSIFLVQHGKNLPKDQDPDKGLSPEGDAEVRRIATVAAGYGVEVSKILHSGKKRARQTAEIFADSLKVKAVDAVEGIGPKDDIAVFSGALTPDQNLMVVGHLPFMERLTAYLTAGDAEKRVFKFQNGGIVCLDSDPDIDGGWMIRWALMPHIS